MRKISQNEFKKIIDMTSIKTRFKQELKFIKSVSNLSDDWSEYELLAISDRTNNAGVLLLQPQNDLYILQYTLSKKIIDSQTGRSRSIICDLCRTWQKGTNATSITLFNPENKKSVRLLCCGDLRCSQHVRTLTTAAVYSRAQLREDLTNEDRIERLRRNLEERVSQLETPSLLV